MVCHIMEVNEHSLELIKKLDEKQAVICVVGLGQVGLPTALSFLDFGYRVRGYDVNEKLIRYLQEGISPSPEKGVKALITRFIQNKSFSLSAVTNVLSSADVIIICVATPLDDTGFGADLSFLNRAIEDVTKNLINLKLIVIESTLPPGTMKEYVIPLIEQLSKKKAGSDFLISFCPERISPGNALQEFTENDRIIGANDEVSYLSTLSLFKNLNKGKIYHTDTTTAEISKLAENSYRDVNIAFANELAIICEQSNTDVQEVIRLANTHPRVNIHKPGPGVGGPCLPKDPYFLIMGKNFAKSVVKTARSINDSMPSHVVDILMRTIRSNKKSKENLNVLILGGSYKSDVNDTRYSPTQSIVFDLKRERFQNITVHDPYSNESFGAKFSSDLNSVLTDADCVIIATGHSMYSSLSTNDFKKGCIIVDAVRLLSKSDFLNSGLIYLAVGA
jgi:UDP-N-acetyl-D-mannosaminuronic acid dehydrogenase